MTLPIISPIISQRIVDEFEKMYKRRNLRAIVGKSKIMVFERARELTVDFEKPYRVMGESKTECN